jgi:hypothetical protein
VVLARRSSLAIPGASVQPGPALLDALRAFCGGGAKADVPVPVRRRRARAAVSTWREQADTPCASGCQPAHATQDPFETTEFDGPFEAAKFDDPFADDDAREAFLTAMSTD